MKKWPRKNKPKSAAASFAPPTRDLKIGEAARLLGVEAYVLRFWETQFPFLRPRQTVSRHRYYSDADVETLKVIKRLLYGEGFTIAGARKFIRAKGLEALREEVNGAPKNARTPNERSNSEFKKSVDDEFEASQNGNLNHALREIREDLRILHALLTAQSSKG